MASRDENESEILLGNRQLLAVFAVVALLLAVAFTGGYMLGKGSAVKKEASAVQADASSTALAPRVVSPDDPPTVKTGDAPPPAESHVEPAPRVVRPKAAPPLTEGPILGKKPVVPEGVPRAGQTFLQVTALTYDQAKATAVVLEKQSYKVRIALKQGTNLYRVLVGPIKDVEETSSTRESLRKIGFRDVFVQKY